jgi:hypothetical protein
LNADTEGPNKTLARLTGLHWPRASKSSIDTGETELN